MPRETHLNDVKFMLESIFQSPPCLLPESFIDPPQAYTWGDRSTIFRTRPERFTWTALSLCLRSSVKVMQTFARKLSFASPWPYDRVNRPIHSTLMPEEFYLDYLELMLELIYQNFPGLCLESFIWTVLSLHSKRSVHAIQAYARRGSFHQLEAILESIQERFAGLRPKSFIWTSLSLCPRCSVKVIQAYDRWVLFKPP